MFVTHQKVRAPKSLYIKKKNGCYTVSFCYEDGLDEKKLKTDSEHLKSLKKKSVKELEKISEGVDIGVKVMVQTTKGKYDYSAIAKERLLLLEKKRKRGYTLSDEPGFITFFETRGVFSVILWVNSNGAT